MASDTKDHVLLVDAGTVSREGLNLLITIHTALTVCAQVDTVAGAHEACVRWGPVVAVVNPEVDSGRGFELIADLPRHHPGLKVVVFLAREDPVVLKRAMRAGAMGCISPATAAGTALRVILHAAQGAPDMVYALKQTSMRKLCGSRADRYRELSAREMQVFCLLGKGTAIKSIAAQLNISVRTVETHQHRISKKLGLMNTRALRELAARESPRATAG